MTPPRRADRAGGWRWRAFALALPGLSLGCGDPSGASPPEATVERSPRDETPAAAAPTAVEPDEQSPWPQDCASLAARAGDDRLDAYALWALCPDQLEGLKLQRALMLNVRSPAEARAVLRDVSLEPELEGLARLLAGELGAPAAPPLPAPTHLLALPLDAQMLSAVALARDLTRDPAAARDDLTRAEALLALAHLESFEGLGLDEREPLPPVGRLLALRTLDHGRRFCVRYIQVRVAGLAPLFARVERALLAMRIRLARGPAVDDPGLAAAVLPAVDRYLELDAVRDRLAKSPPRNAAVSLHDLPSARRRALTHIELHNVVSASRWAKRAIEDPDDDPMDVADALTDALDDAGLERHTPRLRAAFDRWSAAEVKRRAAARAKAEALARERAEAATDGDDGETARAPAAPTSTVDASSEREDDPEPTPPDWSSAADVALEVERALTDPRARGFAGRWVQVRAERRLVERPDALLVLLGRAEAVPELAPLLVRLVAHLEAEHLRAARALEVLHALAPSEDVERRRRADFAARTRAEPSSSW